MIYKYIQDSMIEKFLAWSTRFRIVLSRFCFNSLDSDAKVLKFTAPYHFKRFFISVVVHQVNYLSEGLVQNLLNLVSI